MVQTPGEVYSSGNIAPLIRAPYLHGTAVLTIEFGKVETLQQEIGKFGERNTGTFSLKPLTHRLLMHHGVNGKMLTHVPEKIQRRQRPNPIEIIDHCRGTGAGVKINKTGDLIAQTGYPTCDQIRGVQLAFFCFVARISNQPGRAADQR